MQLKGLVRFFTIVLILVSLYVLSFTWFVRGHESKMEKLADKEVASSYPAASVKFPGNKDSQAVYQMQLDTIKANRLKRLLDSTKDEVITYGITGAVTYQKAKEEELNLGLDLQGGMNVTLEVEMTGLLKTLSNNSKDPNFLKAIDNANKRKANSDANFVTLFVDEYKKLAPGAPLAPLFTAASGGQLKFDSDNTKVTGYLNDQAKAAFDNTFRVLNTRIDQFGVAQPNINPDRDRGTITIELPGIQDKERVRKYLQSSANLQFWEVYNISEIWPQIVKADQAFYAMMGGKEAQAKVDTTAKTIDTTGQKKIDTTQGTAKISDITGAVDTGGAKASDSASQAANEAKRRLANYIGFAIDQQAGQFVDNGTVGFVPVRDTALVRSYLQSDAVRRNFPNDLVWMYGIQEKKAQVVTLYAIRTNGREKAKLEGEVITNAVQDYDQKGLPAVSMTMNATGARIWADMTRAAAGAPDNENDNRHIAIALDNIVYSAPRVSEAIEGGTSSISGGFTVEEAQDLANILKSGKLSAPAKIVQEQQVGPTLGAEAIKGGLMAFGISFIVIFLLMLVYYNTSGWIANIALILNLLFTIGVLTALGATLTAPGIAGLVLTIGMAVDTNVIIYERIKEELSKGKGYIPAINEGYKRSLPPVLDAHVTTLLTAIILFYFGLGPVKGFATTQILGIILSLFCGILVSRWVSDMFTNKKRHMEYFTGISRRIFKHAKYKFIEYRKIAYIISIVVLLGGIAAFFNGFDEGVEFKGGRSYTVAFNTPAKVEAIRDELKTVFDDESPVIKTVGNASTLDITTAYLIDSTGQNVDNVVEEKLLGGLKNYDVKGIIGFKKVLPTISDDLKMGAIQATIFAIIVIFLYIFIRFRDWRYSLGTIIALLHDVFVALIVFSFLKGVVPFPLEIDQHFIAAILTVIGFSMNDTVIVFDRIREDRKLYPTAPLGETINRAINETLSRTIMTSLTVFLTILILFLVGGEVTKGFAFAMLIGVITGTYSSIFVAAPILVDLTSKKSSAPKAEVKQATDNKA